MQSSPPQNVFCFQHNKCIHLLFGRWKTCEETETRGKGFFKTVFQLMMDLKKGQKEDRDERIQEDYPTSAVYFADVR